MALAGQGASISMVAYALALISSRMFGVDGGSMMVPLADMANHSNNCK